MNNDSLTRRAHKLEHLNELAKRYEAGELSRAELVEVKEARWAFRGSEPTKGSALRDRFRGRR